MELGGHLGAPSHPLPCSGLGLGSPPSGATPGLAIPWNSGGRLLPGQRTADYSLFMDPITLPGKDPTGSEQRSWRDRARALGIAVMAPG